MSRLQEFAGTQDLAINLTLRELRGRYKRSVLGWTWSLLNPLATVAHLLARLRLLPEDRAADRAPERAALVRALPAVRAGAVELLPERAQHGARLADRQRQPHQEGVLPARAARRRPRSRSLVVTLLIELGVLGVILLLVGNMVLPWIPVVLVLVVIETVFVFGIALVLVGVQRLLPRRAAPRRASLLQVLFYTVPIVYPIRYVPVHAHVLGVEIPLLRIYTPQPAGALRRVLPRRALRPALPAALGPRCTSIAVGGRRCCVVGMWVFRSSTAVSPRRCDGGAGDRRSTTSGRSSASTTSATSR